MSNSDSILIKDTDDVFKKRAILSQVQVAQAMLHDHRTLILVLYTGGTIGMKTNQNGVYEPKPNFLINELKKLPMFHDTEYADKHGLTDVPNQLVLPHGNLSHHITHDNSSSQGETKTKPSDYRITRSDELGKRVLYRIIEYSPLLDSTNMMMSDWTRIATDINTNYDDYDGFVILHGTDTMAYTASALSFMCENLGKPVILTGSQIPIFEVRSDGRDNFLSSLIVAGHYLIPEVMVCFDNKVLRGNRTIKCDAGSFTAFTSPNIPPLAEMEIDIKVDWQLVHRSAEAEKFQISTVMCENVGLLRLFPGITSQTVRAFLTPPMQGIVLQSYGTGNAPDNRPDLLKIFEEAVNIGIIIINITQCTRGYVDAAYATGKALYDKGVIPGGDMTPEAALTKLSYVLGKSWPLDRKKEVMKKNLRGEVTNLKKEDMSVVDFELIQAVSKTLSVSGKEEVKQLKDALYPNLMCAAAKNGDIASLEKLRDTGGNLSSPNQDGRTALHVAAREGHLDVVQFLLGTGASIHIKDHHDCTPLIDAIEGQHFTIISLLINTGAHLRYQHPIKVAMQLCCAAAQNDVNVLTAWRAAGVDLNSADYDLRTPLHVAVSTKQIEAVKYLIENGAQTDLEDVFGTTALQQAEKPGFENVRKLFKS